MTAQRRPVPSTHGSPGAQRTGKRVGAVISGTVLIICNLLTLLYTVMAWLAVPSGIGDTNIIEAAWYVAFLSTGFALVTAMLTVIPVTAGWLRGRWLVVPAVLFLAATARWMYIESAYPEWSENSQSAKPPPVVQQVR